MLSTAPSRCRRKRSRFGTDSTHWRTGRRGKTWSVRCAAVSPMHRVLHEGHNAPTFAGIGHEAVMPAVITPGARKAMGKDAAFQIFEKGLAGIGLGGRVLVALAVELACTGQLKPGLEMLGEGLVEQSPPWVARVAEFGFGS